MSQLTSTLKVVVNASGARSGAAQVTASVTSMATASNRAINSMSSSVGTFEKALKSAQNRLLAMASSAFGVAAIYKYSRALTDATQVYASFIAISKVSTGTLKGAQDSFDYITKVSNLLGISLESNIKVFGKFQAAMKPMDKTGELTRHVFEGLSVAASGLHLNSMQLELSFKAIEQAASKNKPTLEEFQRQLAEHIPGAMAYLAEGVGLRMDEIHGAISKGTISVKDLLVGFANVLKKRFGDAAEYAAEQLPAAINRVRNSFFLLNVEVSKKGAADGLKAIAEAVTDLAGRADITQAIADAFKSVGFAVRDFLKSITPEDINQFGETLKNLGIVLSWLITHFSDIVKILSSIIVGNYLGKMTLGIIELGSKAKAAGIGLGVLQTALVGIRTALMGPLGIIALVGTLIYLLTKLDSVKPKVSLDVRDVNGNVVNMSSAMAGGQQNIPSANKPRLGGGSSLFNSAQSKSPFSFGPMKLDEGDMALVDLLKPMELPGDTPVNPAGGKGKSDLEKLLENTPIMQMREYMSLLKQLDAQYKKGKIGLELYAQAYQALNDKYVSESSNGLYKSFDSSIIMMIDDQSKAINELNADMMEAGNSAVAWQSELDLSLKTLMSSASGDTFTPLFAEVDRWFNEEIRKLQEISGQAPEAIKKIVDTLNTVKKSKMEAATLEGASAMFGKSQEIISMKEQSLQSQVITGVISEARARIELKEAIGEQGRALQETLLPVLNQLMTTVTDESQLALVQSMIDKIKEMVEIGNQTTGMEGLKDGLKEYANSVTDVFTGVKNMVVDAFKGMEDAIVDFVMTGKMNFSSLADSIIKDMVRIMIQQSITKPLAQFAMSLFANGGAFTNGVHAFAGGGILGPNGGILKQPTIFPMANGSAIGLGGEAGDEAVMPIKRLSNGKLGVHADGSGSGSGSGSVAVSITINDNRTQTETKSREGDSKMAPKLAQIIETTVHDKLLQEMRPGGLLA